MSPTDRCALDPAFAMTERLGELRDEPVLQIEDVVERAVRLCLGLRLAAVGIDDARGDPQAIAGTLEAADDGAIEVKLGAQRSRFGAASLHRLDDAHAIDDAHGATMARRSFVTVSAMPDDSQADLPIAADVGEIQHRDRSAMRRAPPAAGWRRGAATREQRRRRAARRR